MSLFRNEKVFDSPDDFWNAHGGRPTGDSLIVNGEKRILCALPRPMGADVSRFSIPFSQSGLPLYPRSDWSAMLKELNEQEACVSDLCDFEPNDQNGRPSCWSQGPCQAGSAMRRKMGLPFKRLSADCVSVPISGGNQGGWEGDAIEYAAKHGWCTTDEWPANDINRRYLTDKDVLAVRAKHIPLKWVDINSFEEWFSVCYHQMPGAFAYNWMSHVMMSSDIVEIEKNSFGFRPRNSWGKWGAANRKGFYGFTVYREGHGTPNSGFALLSMTSAL